MASLLIRQQDTDVSGAVSMVDNKCTISPDGAINSNYQLAGVFLYAKVFLTDGMDPGVGHKLSGIHNENTRIQSKSSIFSKDPLFVKSLIIYGANKLFGM